MRHINVRFTYLLTYLLTNSVHQIPQKWSALDTLDTPKILWHCAYISALEILLLTYLLSNVIRQFFEMTAGKSQRWTMQWIGFYRRTVTSDSEDNQPPLWTCRLRMRVAARRQLPVCIPTRRDDYFGAARTLIISLRSSAHYFLWSTVTSLCAVLYRYILVINSADELYTCKYK